MVGFFTRFQDEEELEQWYSDEKERLDTEFSKAIEGNYDHAEGARSRYNSELKRLVSKYQQEYSKLIPRILKRK